MCRMLTPHLCVCMLAANNSHLVTLTKNEYIGVGSHRVMRRSVIQLPLSEYHLLKSALGALDAGILDKSCKQCPRSGKQSFPL